MRHILPSIPPKPAPLPLPLCLATLRSTPTGVLNNIREVAGKLCMDTLFRHNSPLIMSQCGSKGSPINIAQMVSCRGWFGGWGAGKASSVREHSRASSMSQCGPQGSSTNIAQMVRCWGWFRGWGSGIAVML